jgi:hypothetical protein
MMLKYGRLGLAASLSGSVGQLGAIRPIDMPVAAVGVGRAADPAPAGGPAAGRRKSAVADPGTAAAAVEARP